MTNGWLRGALALGIVAGAAMGVGCGGAAEREPASAEQVANTQLVSLRIEGMT